MNERLFQAINDDDHTAHRPSDSLHTPVTYMLCQYHRYNCFHFMTSAKGLRLHFKMQQVLTNLFRYIYLFCERLQESRHSCYYWN